MDETKRVYNPELAESLEDLLNGPYNTQEGPECSECGQDDAAQYDLNGYIQDDGQGVYVEKVCKKCGATTGEGDGDFYTYFRFDIEHDIIRLDEEERLNV